MKKFFTILAAALMFGVVAGGVMIGVNALAKNRLSGYETRAKLPEDTTQAQTETETIEQTAPAEENGGISKTSNTGTGSIENERRAVLLDVSDIVEEAMPQVVSITNTMLVKQQGYGSLFDYFYGNGSVQEYEVPASGSGVILQKTKDELLIVTNNHVIEDSKELTVTFIDGESVTASLKGTDPVIDIAVIAVPMSEIKESTLKAIEVATLHDTEDLRVGEGVIAIGNALGFGQSVTVGYISALGREIQSENSIYTDLIQVDAAINPGNSGGALLNMKGELIGINVAKYSQTSVEGVGYSIPIYKAVSVIEGLSSARTKVEIPEEDRGRLGVFINTISTSQAQTFGMPAGVIVVGFSDDETEGYTPVHSPARDAGLLKNDIITKFDGQNVRTADELTGLVAYYEAGSEVEVVVQRLNNGDYEEKTFKVKLDRMSETAETKDKDAGQGALEEKKKPQGKSGNEDDKSGWNKWFGSNGNDRQKPEDRKAEEKDGSGKKDEERKSDGNGQGGAESYDSEIYDLFREFMENYK